MAILNILRFPDTRLRTKAFEVEADGLFAVCIQHEIDHLNGKIFVDYLSPLKQKRLRKKMEKMAKMSASA